MTIRTTLTEIYPDLQFMGTRRLGTKYVLSRGMRGYFVSNRLTGKIVCTWDTDGNLYATTDGLSAYEKRLITMILNRLLRGLITLIGVLTYAAKPT